MSLVIFGRIRIRYSGPARLSVAEQWPGNCRSIWERRFDHLHHVLAESFEVEWVTNALQNRQ